MGETGDYTEDIVLLPHATTHKSGGSDEIDISGLVHTSVCKAYLGSAQNISDTTDTIIALDTPEVDRNSDFDTANNQFVVPETGVYLVLAALKWLGLPADKYHLIYILKNSTTLAEAVAQSAIGYYQSNNTFAIASFAANDTIRLQVYQNSGGTEGLVANAKSTFLLVVRLY